MATSIRHLVVGLLIVAFSWSADAQDPLAYGLGDQMCFDGISSTYALIDYDTGTTLICVEDCDSSDPSLYCPFLGSGGGSANYAVSMPAVSIDIGDYPTTPPAWLKNEYANFAGGEVSVLAVATTTSLAVSIDTEYAPVGACVVTDNSMPFVASAGAEASGEATAGTWIDFRVVDDGTLIDLTVDLASTHTCGHATLTDLRILDSNCENVVLDLLPDGDLTINAPGAFEHADDFVIDSGIYCLEAIYETSAWVTAAVFGWTPKRTDCPSCAAGAYGIDISLIFDNN